MAFDEKMAQRIGKLLMDEKGISTKQMFGGIAFMVDSKMFIGLVKDELMVRVGKEAHAALLKKPGARTMDFTGRPMIGYLFVAPSALKTAANLKFWVGKSLEYTKTVTKKPKAKAKKKVKL